MIRIFAYRLYIKSLHSGDKTIRHVGCQSIKGCPNERVQLCMCTHGSTAVSHLPGVPSSDASLVSPVETIRAILCTTADEVKTRASVFPRSTTISKGKSRTRKTASEEKIIISLDPFGISTAKVAQRCEGPQLSLKLTALGPSLIRHATKEITGERHRRLLLHWR